MASREKAEVIFLFVLGNIWAKKEHLRWYLNKNK
jgi:hypothetical protein